MYVPAKGLRAIAVLWASLAGALANCGECEVTGKTGSVLAPVFFKKLDRYTLPEVAGVKLAEAPEDPLVFEMLVGMDGKVCSVAMRSEQRRELAEVSRALREALSAWTFKPSFRADDGSRVCLESRIFVYIRRAGGKTTLLIPYLTDAGNKPK